MALSSDHLIFIRGLRCETILGIHAWERLRPRPVLIDLEIEPSHQDAFAEDSARGLMNYDAIATRLSTLLPSLHYHTIERLAAHVAQVVVEEFHAPAVRVTIGKPGAVGNAQMVGVTLVRRASAAQAQA